ncbi:MAG: hypothetical protein HYW33_00780 [Candidatus Blackburnbacteria bacterium]|nr:hypothetical protein [Candidatus Blackburnbacteria bacterium]
MILLFGLVLHLYPSQNHNFYFTIDQGDDAVHAREFFDRGKIIARGPETGIQGVYSGPGWFYFISIGYKLFGGDPFGALVMIILLNLAASGLLMWWIGKRISPALGLLVGAVLQIFWPFYDTSRWAFSPFPLVASSIVLMVILSEWWNTKKNYWWGIAPILVALNAELAGAVALLLFYGVVGVIGVTREKLKCREFVLSTLLLPGLGVAGTIKQFVQVYLRTHTIPFIQSANVGTFQGTSFLKMVQIYAQNLSEATIPQVTWLGVLVFLGILGLHWGNKGNRGSRGEKYTRAFVVFVFGLFATSYLFFSSNRGFQDWHDVFLPPLLFVSVVLILFSLWRELKIRYYKVGIIGIVGVIGVSQLMLSGGRYLQYLHPSDDPGLLVNQMKVLDWIYAHADGNGFNEYTYVPTVEDDKYQYLFWWYGRQKYGYLPCEYSNLPKSIKYLYIPNSEEYKDPHLGCEYNVFLIIEPDAGKGDAPVWYEKAVFGTISLEQSKVGSIKVEKRRYPPKI